jgi:DNA processing protein
VGRGLGARDFQRECDALARLGVRIVPLPSPAYPARLRRLTDAPPVLAVRGDPGLLTATCVAMVGSRAATPYGLWAAREIAGGLSRAGVVVVSGLARGIDAAAHRSALGAGGSTLAVQGCGPDRIHPPSHAALSREIVQQGAVVSEFPPGTPPLPHHFPLRNRVISAISQVVVVVEARERSGSLLTARHAADQGVDVMVVPGPIDAAAHAGANRLLRDGAGAVTGVEDVLMALGLVFDSASAPQVRPGETAGGGILAALADQPQTRDELDRSLAQPPAAIALALLELEMEGLVAQGRDGRLRAVSPGRDPRL